ncbi:MAG: alpha/beta hydrolase [Methylophaga sp.]|nr:alpha/beta hydrolase [Methylophaga sp.]
MTIKSITKRLFLSVLLLTGLNGPYVFAANITAYDALSHPPERMARPNEVDLSIYREAGEPEFGIFKYTAPADGLVLVDPPHGTETKWTNAFEIAYTKMGVKGPIVLFLHGVPTNRRQWEGVQHHVSRFARTISIDMLGMGESTKPRMYGKKNDKALNDRWFWKHDTDYIEKLMQHEYPGEKFIFVADDWGAGIATHYAAKYNDKRLHALIEQDPIAFDGYPVNEIQAVGRASLIPNTIEGDAQFAAAMGAFDQTLVQILKTMVHVPAVYNQYNMRNLVFPYVDVDYARNPTGDGITDTASSISMKLKLHNIRVLADRAAVLSPSQLLPYHAEKNPEGVDYNGITIPTLIMWGEYDNMMPAAQTQRYANILGTDDVQITYIPRAGHFPAEDQPELVADTIVNFVRRVMGRSAMADINLGNDGIWKGDEHKMIKDLRVIHNIE